MRSGSRLLSGASMDDDSMLLEHTLLTSGEVAEAGAVYAGWPARPLDQEAYMRQLSVAQIMSALHLNAHYTKLQRKHYQLEDEKRKLDRKIEDHQRELREASRRLEGMLKAVETMRGPPSPGGRSL